MEWYFGIRNIEREAGLAWLSRSRELGYFRYTTLGGLGMAPAAEWQMRLHANMRQMSC